MKEPSWKGFDEVPKFTSWAERITYYRTRHPIVVGYAILAGISLCWWAVYLPKMADPLAVVKKYKHGYYVYRPDDPKVKMLKTRRTGLDILTGN